MDTISNIPTRTSKSIDAFRSQLCDIMGKPWFEKNSAKIDKHLQKIYDLVLNQLVFTDIDNPKLRNY